MITPAQQAVRDRTAQITANIDKPAPTTPAPVPATTPSNGAFSSQNMSVGVSGGYDPKTGMVNTPSNPPSNGNQTTQKTEPNTPVKSTDQINLDKVSQDQQDAAQKFSDTITHIQNGSIPLSAGEQAQVQGLQQQFQALIQQQQTTNKASQGTANIRGYQTGAAEYDPNFQAKTIGSLISAGNAKVADLNIKMASAVANLTQSLKDNDISKIKMAYDAMTEASDKRQAQLTKTIETTQKAIKDAQEQELAAMKDNDIATLFDMGITNPSEILHNLQASGKNYTLKDIDESLKIIDPPADLAGLSADYRTFQALKKVGDPSVKNLDWMQYQRAITNATSKVASGLGGGGGGSGGGGNGGYISPYTQAIIDNPSLFDDLTPTMKGQIINELQANGFNTTNLGVKGLSDTAITAVAQSQSALSNLQALKTTITNNLDKVGPITGLAAINPYSQSRKIQAEIDRVKQTVGKALEGGVLRKEDEEKYKKILATITDTPDTALYKIDALITSVNRDIENYKNLQQSGGKSLDIHAPLIKNGVEVPKEDLRNKYGY